MKTTTPITKRLNGVLFSYYTSQEIRNLSVVEIKNINAFDHFGRPQDEGLYDLKMGVSPYERNTSCVTCGQEESDCPGHMGHIELVMPVYNCFLMNELHKILRVYCWQCHKVKFSRYKEQEYKNLFALIKLGLIEEFNRYIDLSNSRIDMRIKKLGKQKQKLEKVVKAKKKKEEEDRRKNSKSTRRSSGDMSEDDHKESKENEARKRNRVLDELYNEISENIKKEKAEIVDILKIKKHKKRFEKGILSTFSTSKCFNDLYKAFLKEGATLNKCSHCLSIQPSVRKEGYSKLILGSLNDKTSISKVLFTGVSDSESENENDEFLDINSNDSSEDEAEYRKKKRTRKFKILHPLEVREHVRLMFENNRTLMNSIFGNFVCNSNTLENSKLGYEIIKFSPDFFFLDVIPVTPNRFRPENKLSDSTYLHPHTTILQKILSINLELKAMHVRTQNPNIQLPQSEDNKAIASAQNMKKIGLKENFTKWIELQETVNSLYDASKSGKINADKDICIKQLLEKKEGIFRMKIMGKRVNFAARSVISPDPLLDTNEVGVPLFMAMKLTFPECVNEANCEKLKKLVINGANTWPGALYVSENGQKLSLEGSTPEQRQSIAKSLLENAENKVVYRHLMNGDVLMFNRQPTLHKPSFMSHVARVLPSEQTIRMHYANCSSYNADFDGDEMNLHFLQNHLARAEAYNLSLTDNQYILPTNKGPIRGLIQDLILSSVFLTMQGTFFEKSEYNQLIYSSLRTLIESEVNLKKIKLLPPAILKPRRLWTGKQVVSTIISIIAERDDLTINEELEKMENNSKEKLKNESLYMKSKTRVGEAYLSDINKEDKKVILQGNELMTGILDKGNIGTASFGLIHCFYELTDAKRTGRLLTSLSRLFCNFLQMHGFTCSLEDLFMNQEFEGLRKQLIQKAHKHSVDSVAKFLNVDDFEYGKKWDMFNRPTFEETPKDRLKKIMKKKPMKDYLANNNELSFAMGRKIVCDENGSGQIDGLIKSSISAIHNEVNKKAMSIGLKKKFPNNNFSMMVLSGAKGSVLNHNQISCMLGQQELEGQRVPIMASGRSLPSFIPYSPNLRAGGYIADRFLTGLRPQEFFFHCMAGREGLIDTAVKTSRSGYLQRILMKNLESLVVQYDYTVRESDGTVVQFLYGEDALDSTKVNPIENVGFMADNFESFEINTNKDLIINNVDSKKVKKWKKQAKKEKDKFKHRVVMNELNPATNFGSISEKASETLNNFIKSSEKFKKDKILKKKFSNLYKAKYYTSLACPGKSVGAIAAQSFGEPSTQMTLNTFHLAGHGGANVTLGIPRLRELLVTKNTKTPSMTIHFKDKVNKRIAKTFARKIQRISLLDLIYSIDVTERKVLVDDKFKTSLEPEKRHRLYKVKFSFENLNAIKFAFGFSRKNVANVLNGPFKTKLIKSIHRIIAKRNKQKISTNLKNLEEENLMEDQNDIMDYDLKNIKMRKQPENPKNKQNETGLPDQSEYDDEDIVENNLNKKAQKKDQKKEQDITDSTTDLLDELKFEDSVCEFSIKLPLNTEKLLMLKIVEDVSKLVTVREVPGIQKCHILTTNNEIKVQTEGVNFQAIWPMKEINPNKIECNDTHAICEAYGIEAARGALVKEINAVFSHYGIKVDYRHLYLVADFMTVHGYVNPMSRAGMQHNNSPFLKMSFETTMKFLTEACLFNQYENLDTPSARLVLGRNVKNGTGVFDVRHDFGF